MFLLCSTKDKVLLAWDYGTALLEPPHGLALPSIVRTPINPLVERKISFISTRLRSGAIDS